MVEDSALWFGVCGLALNPISELHLRNVAGEIARIGSLCTLTL